MSQEQTRTDSEYWARYYAITGERPAWATVLRAIELFGAEGGAGPRFAVDLGCGPGTLQDGIAPVRHMDGW